MKKWAEYGLIFVGAVLVLFVHLYRLTEIPLGLHADEAGAAYDAFSISRYGVDRALDSYPFYFTNYGDGQNALYIYMMVLLFKLFGRSLWTIRMGMVIAACAAACFGFLYAFRRWNSKTFGIVTLYLYAILPVFIMTQRFGLESHLMLSAAAASIYFSARALETGRWYVYLLAGCALGITLYTYALSYIVVPLFVLFLFCYSLRLGKVRPGNVVSLIVPLFLLATPLILVQLVNLFQWPEFQIGPFTVTRLARYRSNELGLSLSSVIANIKTIFCNTLFHDNLLYNSLARYGNLYKLSVPFVLLGLGRGVGETICSVREKKFHYSVPMVSWWLGECIMGVLMVENSVPNVTRMNGIFMPYLYFLVTGLWTVRIWLKAKWQRAVFVSIVSAAYAVLFCSFARYYFTEYTKDTFPLYLFYEPYDGMKEFLEQNQNTSWAGRMTCYPWNYVYHMIEFEVDPYEINIPARGEPNWGAPFRGDCNFGYPGELIVGGNYVVHESDTAFAATLEKWGYERQSVGKFYFYISPLESCVQPILKEGMGSLDNMKEKDGMLTLSGWWVDTESNRPYEQMWIRVNGREYPAEKSDRADVAAYYGNEDYLQSGYVAQIPTEDFWASEYVELAGMTQEGEKKVFFRFSWKSLDN